MSETLALILLIQSEGLFPIFVLIDKAELGLILLGDNLQRQFWVLCQYGKRGSGR